MGTAFETGETVELQVLHNDGLPNTGGGHEPWQVTDGSANDLDGRLDGNIRTTWYVNPDDSLNSSFELTATGSGSGLVATTTFTDSLTTFVWDGGGADSNWTTPENWASDVAPSADDALIFPVDAAQTTNVNDFANGTQFGSILFEGSNYSVSGNQIVLTGAIANNGGSNNFGAGIQISVSSGGIAIDGWQHCRFIR